MKTDSAYENQDDSDFIEAVMNDPSLPFPPGFYVIRRTIEIKPRHVVEGAATTLDEPGN